MNKWSELFVGLVLVLVAVSAWILNFWDFGTAALAFFKGGLVWFFIMVGALFILLGLSDLKG